MPETRDIAALPTSWALTIWDALPVFLSIELAVAVLVVALLRSVRRVQAWRFTAALPFGAFVYLGLFNSGLALVMAAAAFAQLVAMEVSQPNGEPKAPDSPWSATRRRGGDIVWAVVLASAVAALVKVILTPMIPSGSALWIFTGIAGGALVPGPLGTAAIPALATQNPSDSMVPAIIWIAIAAARPRLVDLLRTRIALPGKATNGR